MDGNIILFIVSELDTVSSKMERKCCVTALGFLVSFFFRDKF